MWLHGQLIPLSGKRRRERRAKNSWSSKRSPKEEIKKIRKKKKKCDQEAHVDDCGSDLEPLLETLLTNVLATSGSFSASVAYRFWEHDAYKSSSVDPSSEEYEHILCDNCFVVVWIGCDGFHEHVDPPKSSVIGINDLLVFLAKLEYVGNGIDVVELFGGEGGVGKFYVRRRLRRGQTFDLVTGFDLID